MKRLGTFTAALLLTSALTPVMAQSPVSVTGPVTPGNLPVFNSTTIIKDSGIPAGGFLPQHPISAAYQLTSADCGSLIVAAGGTFYAVSQSGAYPVNCVVRILNNDPMPTGANSTGAKFVNFVNCVPSESGTYLWPQQTMDVVYVNSGWVPLRCPGLWELPSGNFAFNVNPTSGSDTWGTADGLALTTRAWKTVANALLFTVEVMQADFLNQTNLNITLCSSCTDTSVVHFPPHGGILNGSGRAGTTLDCNSGTMTGTINLFLASATLQVQNCTFTNTIGLSEGAELIIAGNNTVTPVSGNAIFVVGSGAKILNGGTTLNVAGGTGANIIDMTGGYAALPPMSQLGNQTWTDVAVRVQAVSVLTFNTWAANGHSTTGVSYALIECGIAENSGLIPGSTGSVSCTQAN